MAETYTVYPNDLDSNDELPVAVDNVTPVKAEVVNRQRSAILAIESELGIQPSGTYATVRARLDALEAFLLALGGSLDGLNLQAILSIGNTTGGNNIVLTSGDALIYDTGNTIISGHVYSQAISLPELSSNPLPIVADKGTIWLRNDNNLIYTDDLGISHSLLNSSVGEITFQLSGEYSAIYIPSYIDSTYVTISNRTLDSVTLARRTAGTSGTTRVDVLKNGVSIFASNPNKPQVTAAAGDSAYNQSTTFTTSSFVTGDFIDVIIDSAETYKSGATDGPEGITVILKFI